MCMYKRYMCLISVILLLGMVGNALAADVDWTNAGGDRLWRNASNWNIGVLPTAADKAAIRNSGAGPIIDSSTAAVANVVVCGDWGQFGVIDITGGSLTTNGWFILGYGASDDGTFNVSGGTTTCNQNLHVGFMGAGHMNMTSGSITVTGTFGIATNGGSGDVQLDGGTISCGSFTMQTGATMDITGGTLIVSGDVTSTIDSYISSGWLTAHGGSGTLDVDTTINPGETTVTAFIPSELPTKATDPTPLDGATNVLITPILSWSAGLGASSHDVYFGTTSPGTFQGNQTAGTFNPGILDQDTTYYWRIDEKNDIGTTTGDVWSFTTTAESSYSLIGKVMCGYQGWFNCPGDGTPRGWVHWGSSGDFTPDLCTVDMWPDMTEYSASEKFLADAFYDGIDHYVFSSHNYDTVSRHFQWMQDYGIDGVYLQRFVTETTPGSAAFYHRNDVLDYCKAGANLYGKKYAVMYDLSGLGSGSDIQRVVNDWMYLVDEKLVGRDPADAGYMTHNGLPVVAVWGLGFGRSYEGQESRDLIDFLKNDPIYGGNIVMLGVNDNWRTNSDTWFQQTLQLGDIISPWWVGRFGNTSGVYSWASGTGVPDKDWCDTNGKEYLPVMFPGFSWYNLKGGTFNQIPREGGQFLWDQVYSHINTVGATMLYVAMFDEVDEATAIFKVTNNPPEVPPAQFVTYDIDGYDLPSDEYLWLVGQATRGLRGEITVNQTRPSRTAQLPGQASNPSPADSATEVDINADLSWTAGNYADSHDVYFGTNPTPDAGQFQGNQSLTSFDPGTLAYDTTYYWCIDEKNTVGTTLGPVWSFTTGSEPDTTAPTPDPMTWAVVPYATGSTSISMTATTATDISGVEYYFTCTAGGGNDSGWQAGTTYEDTGLTPDTTYTYTVTAGDLSANLNETAASSGAAATTDAAPDTDPPTPNPATFASAPSADSSSAISMTATTGSDTSGPVEYLFTETSGNPGGTSSAWQTSTSYTDSGLNASTQYTYTVTMRDALDNTGTASAPANATTDAAPDTDPPTPNPATFAVAPSADSSSAISMTATTGSDASGPVEYLFTETSGNPGGTSSAWQTSTSYTDSGLNASTQYTYTVTMRDALDNTGTVSAPASATTDDAPALPAAPSSLSATAIAQTRIDLSWTDNASDETGFKIERSRRVNTAFVQIATVGQDVTSYSDTTVRKNKLYYYRVRATNASGDSAYSNEANAKTPK